MRQLCAGATETWAGTTRCPTKAPAAAKGAGVARRTRRTTAFSGTQHRCKTRVENWAVGERGAKERTRALEHGNPCARGEESLGCALESHSHSCGLWTFEADVACSHKWMLVEPLCN
jgi:hypothetical protein